MNYEKLKVKKKLGMVARTTCNSRPPSKHSRKKVGNSSGKLGQFFFNMRQISPLKEKLSSKTGSPRQNHFLQLSALSPTIVAKSGIGQN